MHHLSGFDSVDDETKPERPILTSDMPYPEEWNMKDNPPYVYYLVRPQRHIRIFVSIRWIFSSTCMLIFLHSINFDGRREIDWMDDCIVFGLVLVD